MKGHGLKAVNFTFRHAFRQNLTAPCPVHFTSQVIEGENIFIEEAQFKTIKTSFAQSGHCYYQAKNGIEIWEGSRWGPGVKFISANRILNSDDYETVPAIVIGLDCLIGAGAIILPGVSLPDNTLVGAGSVVTKSFDQDCLIIAGNPAKIIGNHPVQWTKC